MIKSYQEKEIVRVARRDGNKKRTFLVVNRLQGKHVPASPRQSLEMFSALAEEVKKAYPGERLLVVGFAETATAIGAALAVELNCAYIQTTREQVGEVEYLYFTESHSHATEQKLVQEDMDALLAQVDRVVFAEDEVTTGNTILKIVNILRARATKPLAFSAASLLNGMDEEAAGRYQAEGIGTKYLVKTLQEDFSELALSYRGDGEYHTLAEETPDSRGLGNAWRYHELGDNETYINTRRRTEGAAYQKACEALWKQLQTVWKSTGKKILVLGTEEFMYPALYVASRLEEDGRNVRFHATTRSPIVVSTEEEYPFQRRHELRSCYDRERVTYVYNLESYDQVLVLTDADAPLKEGLWSLAAALQQAGNTDIQVIQWHGGKAE